MNWLGKGLLKTEGEVEFWGLKFGQKTETIFTPVTSKASETAYSFTFDSRVFSHKTDRKYSGRVKTCLTTSSTRRD
jgi:hypothetical protein